MIFILLTIVFLALDLGSKYLAHFCLSDPLILLDNFWQIALSKNNNLAFSIPFPYWGQIIFSVVLLSILAHYLYREQPLSKFTLLAGSLIFGGALGNLIERILFSEVSDFIDFSFWPSFNLADSFIFIGALLLLLDSFRGDLKKK